MASNSEEKSYGRMRNGGEGGSASSLNPNLIETPEEKSKRMRSIKIVHLAMFVFSLGFSIVITGVYPYMQQV